MLEAVLANHDVASSAAGDLRHEAYLVLHAFLAAAPARGLKTLFVCVDADHLTSPSHGERHSLIPQATTEIHHDLALQFTLDVRKNLAEPIEFLPVLPMDSLS